MYLPRRGAQAEVENGGAERVGDDRRDGDAVDRHAQHGDEEQVQRHVHNARDGQRQQRDLRLADASEDGCLEVIQQDHGHAQQIDPQIQQRQREHVVRHLQQAQQRRRRQLAERGHEHAAQQRHEDRREDGLLHGVFIALPDGVRDDDVRAERDADEEVHQQADDRAVRAHGGYGRRPLRAGEVADDRDVRGVEELLQNRRRRHREGEQRNLVPDGAMEHVKLPFCSFCFHVCVLFQYVKFFSQTARGRLNRIGSGVLR